MNYILKASLNRDAFLIISKVIIFEYNFSKMSNSLQSIQTAKIALTLSIFATVYWIGSFLIQDVYKWAFVGAVYEILWLPAVLALYVTPVLLVLLMLIKKFKLNPLFYISLVLLITTLSLLFTVFK